ncbi:hypothetical protein DFH08DRAFT_969040 [Mycena albidolilacea]|uniref:Uncharacterized protein n=1 Tax=Mycena albidolilacea TaxID=1033008 RepID=A0AAD6ZIM0_9AGAR|nr:hypothetical protein DFH08DRAFT_969040 [Mycena albidolilacea]
MQIHSIVLACTLRFVSAVVAQPHALASSLGQPISWPLRGHGVAAVGLSIAVSLLVSAGALLCPCHHTRKTTVMAVDVRGAHTVDLRSRYAQLECEVRELHEQLDGLHAQRLAGGFDGEAVLYTHETNAAASKDVKPEKEKLRTYALSAGI